MFATTAPLKRDITVKERWRGQISDVLMKRKEREAENKEVG